MDDADAAAGDNTTEAVMVTQKDLKDRFIYEPDTGLWYRRDDAVWAGKHGGKLVLGSRVYHPNGRPHAIYMQVRGRAYPQHRLVWLYMTGEMPNTLIDHKNRDGFDNRWENLRLADKRRNAQNRNGAASHSKSGVLGVHAYRHGWRVRIKINGKETHVGVYKTVEEAKEAYREASRMHFGEFASE